MNDLTTAWGDWLCNADKLLQQLQSLQRRAQRSRHTGLSLEAQILYKLAHDCAVEGLALSGRSLPIEEPDTRLFGIDALHHLVVDPRITGATFDEWNENIRAHEERKETEIENGSFAHHLSFMPMLETLKLEMDVYDCYLPRLHALVDNAKIWVFP